MKIGVIGAMEEEIVALRQTIAICDTWQEGIATIYHGTYAGHEIYLVQSGIGKVSAAVTATILLAKGVDILINTGTAGGIGQHLHIGDIVIADKLAYHDVDVTAFGYDYGQMAGGMPLYYESDAYLVRQTIDVMQQQQQTYHVGLMVSGDQFVHSDKEITRIKQAFPQAIANEMESTAIAQVAYEYCCPFVAIRSISDVADEEANVSFDQFVQEAGSASAKAVLQLLTQLPSQREMMK